MTTFDEARRRGAPFWRAAALSLALLPVALSFSAAYFPDRSDTWLWLLAVFAAALLGRSLIGIRYLPPWLQSVLLLAAGIAAAVHWRAEWAAPAGYLGVAWWTGSLSVRLPRTSVALTGIAANAVALIAVQWAPGLAPYRTLWIVAGIVWFAELLYAMHAAMLASAGLESGIVTRIVSRSSRIYVTGMLVAVLIVYLATSDFHLWREIVHFINSILPHSKPGQPEQTPEAPPAATPMLPTEGTSKPGLLSKILNVVMYVFAGAIAAGLLWLLVRRFLLNREWLRTVRDRLRALLARMFRQKEPPAALAYTDEKESLLDIGKALRQVQNRWRQRGRRKPLTRQEWDSLPAEAKVRRLYQDSVAAGVGKGFALRASDAPQETLDSLEAWYEGQASAARGGGFAPAAWLKRTRRTLLVLYWKTRYGGREATPEELAELAAEYPWGERK
ncbi:hypothetical protein [Cohnella zeiphila]|uniref:DUF4129 domain-containing protein n=1 Tax=Cohnella zeiphila TaxID=2761120 RepID=A0A7X0SPI3_9BACL|nr:hypothetical protein [Cohnella zeiphila]MBB6733787.1 hypothetical protein [Cohnella zeiphila]